MQNRRRSNIIRRPVKKPPPASLNANALVPVTPLHRSKFGWWFAALILIVMLSVGGIAFHVSRGTSRIALVDAPQAAPAAFVGSQECAGCHDTEAALWRNSQHKRAMQHATEKT